MMTFAYADHQRMLKYQASNVEKQDRKKPHTHTINNKDKGKYSKTKPSIPGCNRRFGELPNQPCSRYTL